jgi:hypothetical protein
VLNICIFRIPGHLFIPSQKLTSHIIFQLLAQTASPFSNRNNTEFRVASKFLDRIENEIKFGTDCFGFRREFFVFERDIEDAEGVVDLGHVAYHKAVSFFYGSRAQLEHLVNDTAIVRAKKRAKLKGQNTRINRGWFLGEHLPKCDSRARAFREYHAHARTGGMLVKAV